MSAILPLFLLETLAAAYFGDLGLHSQRTIVAIAMAESGGDIRARHDNVASGHQPDGSSAHTDYGLLQINSIHGFDSERLLSEPAYNFECGRKIYDNAGSFNPWVTYQKGIHINHLRAAEEYSNPRRFGGYLRLLWQAAKTAPEAEASMIPLLHVNGQDRYLLRRVR